jgi:selenide,water dikinase
MKAPAKVRPIEHRVILVGAGNAHLVFVRRWKMRPLPGVAVTLVNAGPTIPYSAMVPGHIAGEYTEDDVTIDLVAFCAAAGVRLITEPVAGIDPASRQIHFESRPPLGYEILSLGIGSVPTPPPGTVESDWSLRLRPVGRLVRKLNDLDPRLKQSGHGVTGSQFRFAVVGGGASGCELALAIRKRFAGHAGFEMTLLHAGERVLPQFNSGAADRIERRLRDAGIAVRLQSRVTGFDGSHLPLESGERLACDAVLWATDPAPPSLLRDTGLSLDPAGYLLVEKTLQSVSRPEVFGTGDCVAFPAYPDLPRNGVMAVREGRVLYDNVAASIRGRPLRDFQPQSLTLSILNTANGSAIATYGRVAKAGRWARRLKDRIDRRWMERFITPPPEPGQEVHATMRCGGCGSKVPGDVLADALRKLDVPDDPRIIVGCRQAEDAAVLRIPGNADTVEVQTVDYFKAFVNDPHVFGKVAALHSLSDLYAMNARPFAAMAIATVPLARGRIQSEMLGEMLGGASAVLREEGVTLTGGHTTEGPELALGFSVTGHAEQSRLFHKGGLRPGDRLILTKPVGTGAILAAWMRGLCRAAWFEGAIRSMLISNRTAGEVFAVCEVHGCTDITGFGLAGHLLEMLDSAKVSARLELGAVPVLAGFAEVAALGVVSTLQEGNARVACRIECGSTPPAWFFDPQTSGGLVAGVRPEKTDNVLHRLRESGATDAAVIGEVIAADGPPVIRVA